MACSQPDLQGQVKVSVNMACSQPDLQGQVLINCQLCEVETKIEWKCVDCDLLLCIKCKDNIHSKVKTAEEHSIINIKEVRSDQDVKPVRRGPLRASSDRRTRHSVRKHPVNIELSIVQVYPTKFGVRYIQISLDDSLWIGSVDDKKKTTFLSFKSSRNLQKVKFEKDNLKIISSFNVDVDDIAVLPSNDLILTDYTHKLKQISQGYNKETDSIYCVEPCLAWCVHVTRDNKVVVGANVGQEEGAVYVMDMKGVHQKIYKRDNNNKPLFIWPVRITSTSTGTLCVIDMLTLDYKKQPQQGRVVMLRKGDVSSIYTGHPTINSENKPFKPRGIVSTPNDNVIVTDPYNYTLHVLNKRGSFLTFYDTHKIGDQYPYSLALNTAGQLSILYIGCTSKDKNEGKLYKLTLSGC